MKTEKLRELERRAAALADGRQLVTACFSTGQRRTMRLPDVIGYMQDCAVPRVVDIEGEAPQGSRQLLELLRGLINE